MRKMCVCSSDRDVHSMVIRSACHAHGGVYKAVISNKLGKAACYAHLYVTGTDGGLMFELREYNISNVICTYDVYICVFILNQILFLNPLMVLQ